MTDSGMDNDTVQILFHQVGNEMARAQQKFGSQNTKTCYFWNSIIGEEYGEACKAALEGDWENYNEELIQVASSALRALVVGRTVGWE